MLKQLVQKASAEAFTKMMEVGEVHAGDLLEDLAQICHLDNAGTAEFKKTSQIKVQNMIRAMVAENITAALESVRSQLKTPLVFSEFVCPENYSKREAVFLKECFEKTALAEREARKQIMYFTLQKFFVSGETSKEIVDQMIIDATPA